MTSIIACLRFSSDNTWEPLEHLDCDDLVKNFEEDRDRKLKKQRIEDFIHKKKTVVEVVFFFCSLSLPKFI